MTGKVVTSPSSTLNSPLRLAPPASPSMRDRFHVRQMRARRDPLLVGLERQSKQIIGNAHIAVSAARDRFRRDGLHLLRHHADVDCVAAVVDEAVVAEAVIEPTEQHDIVLEAHVRATPTSSSAAPATSATAAATMSATAAAPEAAAAS